MKIGDKVVLPKGTVYNDENIYEDTVYVVEGFHQLCVSKLSGIECMLMKSRFKVVDSILEEFSDYVEEKKPTKKRVVEKKIIEPIKKQIVEDKINSVPLDSGSVDINEPMKVTIIARDTDISVVEWFIKHKVSNSVVPLDICIDLSFTERK